MGPFPGVGGIEVSIDGEGEGESDSTQQPTEARLHSKFGIVIIVESDREAGRMGIKVREGVRNKNAPGHAVIAA